MAAPVPNDQLNEPQLLTTVTGLITDLRMLRILLQMEQQQALVLNNSAKGVAIKQALIKKINNKSFDTVLDQLEAIRQRKSPWVPSATRSQDNLLDDISEVVNDGSKIGQKWLALLQTYQVVHLPTNPLFHQ